MIFETPHYKLALKVRWVAKPEVPHKTCTHCNGQRYVLSDDAGLGGNTELCERCKGTGKSIYPDAPPPPEISQKFLDDLKEWFNNYDKKVDI